jgi:hypothetical protein
MRVIVHNHLARDGLAERIAGAKALYLRPGTEGERQAAAAALKRMGVDLPKLEAEQAQRAEPSQPKPAYGRVRKKYEVILQYTYRDQTMYTHPFIVEAFDDIAAEGFARLNAKANWRRAIGGRAPEFRAYSTKRV